MYTPEQLAAVNFGKKFGGGYNTEDVDSVFGQLTADYENLYNENISLKTKMRVIVSKLEEYRNAEESMKQAVIDTKNSCEQMVADTKVQCAGMIRDAEAAAIEADAKIALEEARVESARQVAARQIGDLYGQLESCLQLLAQIRETHKPINPLPEAPAPEKAEPEKPAPQKTIPPLKNDPSADMFANLQFGRNYDTGKKR
ncbi:MAG: DivIVA domain-containing protein [Ruminococcaceae bacterium]|nr:DivIVA domain-containing protein [Oscillospiraceae bacterium]